jgi:hypothetical protein
MVSECVDDVLRDLLDAFPLTFGESSNEVCDEEREVF